MGDGGHHLEHRDHLAVPGLVVAGSGTDERFGAGMVGAETARAWWEGPWVWCGPADLG